ncbi:MAG: glycerophosphoryl diester phosphodiesterase [uncultured archaeon A07HN63]|nr:MAG: glycerophosphoryl diester phosphodiesterase [uncultured archaeon A07HN63]
MGREDSADESALSGEPQLIAHRGYDGENPENTIPAVRAAASDSRTDAIEIDVRATRDGEIIVFHDDDLSRLTDAPMSICDTPIWELSYETLSGYTIGDSDASIPTLTAVLAAIPASITVNIELKHPGCEGVRPGLVDTETRAAAIDRWNPFVRQVFDIATTTEHDILASSFYEGALAAARATAPTIPLAPLVGDSVETALIIADRYDAAAIHPSIDLLFTESLCLSSAGKSLREAAQTADWQLNVWTITTQTAAVSLQKLGVDGIISETPEIVPLTW